MILATFRPVSPKVTTPLIEPSDRYGEFLDTRLHYRLNKAADQLLYKAGFFQRNDELLDDEYIPLDADCISAFGLRPTWHGTV